MSRKLREGVSIQINEGKIYNKAVLFLGEEFVRIQKKRKDKNSILIIIGLQSVQSEHTVRVNKNSSRCLYSVKDEELKFVPSFDLH
ncbi:MAG: hypothetical protein AB9861_02040 [Methanosarcina sp.]